MLRIKNLKKKFLQVGYSVTKNIIIIENKMFIV